ncbi:MAG: V-type ATP synthase subunit F [Bacillota bacterium]|nr:MAG: V-type ATP synthase subunit F [Bacillota bacterium]
MKGKTAIIGDGDSVLAFKAVGMDAFSADHPEKARNLLKKLAKTYQIIFITDVLAKEIDETLAHYASAAYPVIISVPSASGGNGYGYDLLRRACEKALGVDILFRDEKKED